MTTSCCICYEECVPGIACTRCVEGKCCWPCSLRLAEEGHLRACPICKSTSWRGEHVSWRYGGSGAHPGEADHPAQPVAVMERDVATLGHHGGYDTDLREDSLCLYVTFWAVGCHSCRLTRALLVFLATWLRGLAVAVVATGSLANALSCGTIWILGAGEAVAFIAAIVDEMR